MTENESNPRGRAVPELWVLGLLVLLIAVMVGHWYVFHGENRDGALWLYKKGRFAAVLAACGLGLLGLVTAILRPPLIRRFRLEGILIVLLVIFSAPIPYAYPSSFRNQPSEVVLNFPLEGSWRVLSGGRAGAHNPLSLEPDRCHGLLLGREVDGRRWKPAATNNIESEQTYTFGSNVLAPVAGTVVLAENDQADRSFQLREKDATGRGNYLAIELATGEFVVLAHLQQGSLRVTVGDRVEVGQPIARVGASGRGIPLTEPHLSLHMSTRPEDGEGEGIPFRMGGYLMDGVPVEAGQPKGGLGQNDGPLGDLLTAGGEGAGPAEGASTPGGDGLGPSEGR